MTRAVVLALAMIVALATPVSQAWAQGFFSSSPGPLAQSHAQWDNQNGCKDCHVNDSKDLSNDKCLDCHDHNDLRDRIRQGKGFHASDGVKGKNCWTCHRDHKGRGYDIMGWQSVKGGEKGLDHDLTGWPLNGKHAQTDCADCHKNRNKQGLRIYMGTDKLCGSSGCHNDDQPHKFERRDMLACERCHGESVWKPAKSPANQKFNHDDRKDAAMGLFGSHKDVACAKCHPKSVFNLPASDPDRCGNSGCHESPHDGHLFGAASRDCEWCHSPTFKTLKDQNFDHTERTRFDLGPAHKKIPCYNCHTKALGESKPTGACEQCHSKDSHHGDRFNQFGSPPKCGVCHPSGGPKFTPKVFNHDRNTNFKLTGKHADVTCRACHRGKSPSDFERLTDLISAKGATDCMGCHQHTNVHEKKYKNNECTQGGCHSAAGKIEVDYKKLTELYHGPKSNFPLVKGHKGVPCGDCHTGRSGKKGLTTFDKIPADCNASGKCHEDSLHKGSLGEDCTYCHSSGVWDALKFDHNEPFPPDAKGEVKQWPLRGEHLKNECEDCHPARKYAETPATCSAEGCHADDDAHKGRLGDKCERCHVETGDMLFNHNTMSVFPLDGKHLDVRCADCHPSITFKPRPTTCFGCHPEPAVHKGQYGTECEQCHTTRTFKDVKPLHDVGDFSLRGMHDSLACERCHKDNRPLAGAGNLCINCHRQDDIHSNSLSPRCGECHTQWSFTPARFDHARVGCNLTGLHRTLACFDCHKNGNFVGLSAQCVSCHRDDARRKDAMHQGYVTCANCHNPNFWSPQAPGTNTAVFARESVCR